MYVPTFLLPASIAFLTLSIFTRYLNPSEYALLSLIVSLSFVLAPVFNWLPSSLLRFNVEFVESGEVAHQNGAVYILFGVVACALLIGGLLIQNFLPVEYQSVQNLITFGLFYSIGRAAFKLTASFVQANRNIFQYGFYSTLYRAGLLILSVFLFEAFNRKYVISVLIAGISIDFLLFGFDFVLRFSSSKIALPSIEQLIQIGKLYAEYGLPLGLNAITRWLIAFSDRIMLKYFGDLYDLGLYSAAYDIPEKSIGILFAILLVASLPILVQIHKSSGESKAVELISSICVGWFIISFGIASIYVSASKEIIMLILGKNYHQWITYVIFPIIGISIVFLGAGDILAQILKLKQQTRKLAAFSLSVAITNIVFNLIVIPRFGSIGAAIVTLISYLAYFCLILSSALKTSKKIRKMLNFHLLIIVFISFASISLSQMLFSANLGYEPYSFLLKIVSCLSFYFLGILILLWTSDVFDSRLVTIKNSILNLIGSSN